MTLALSLTQLSLSFPIHTINSLDSFQDPFSLETVKPVTDPAQSHPCSPASPPAIGFMFTEPPLLLGISQGLRNGPGPMLQAMGLWTCHLLPPQGLCSNPPLLPQVHIINSNSSNSSQLNYHFLKTLPKIIPVHDSLMECTLPGYSLSWGTPPCPFVILNHLCISQFCGFLIHTCSPSDCENRD